MEDTTTFETAKPQRARETLSNEDIQTITGLGRDKVLELLRAGRIPSIRVGRRFLVTRTHLDAFLQGKTE